MKKMWFPGALFPDKTAGFNDLAQCFMWPGSTLSRFSLRGFVVLCHGKNPWKVQFLTVSAVFCGSWNFVTHKATTTTTTTAMIGQLRFKSLKCDQYSTPWSYVDFCWWSALNCFYSVMQCPGPPTVQVAPSGTGCWDVGCLYLGGCNSSYTRVFSHDDFVVYILI